MGTGNLNLNADQLQISPIQNQQVAGRLGPLAVRLFMDFSVQNEYDVNLQNVQAQNKFDLCQTVFIDNSAGGAAVTLTIGVKGSPTFTVVAKAGTQGYYQVICPNPIVMQFTSSGGAPCTAYLINIAISGVVWSAV